MLLDCGQEPSHVQFSEECRKGATPIAYLMIVDDDADFADAVAIALRGEGHEVAIKLETTAAMTEMQSRPPDLVILDGMFPGDDFAGFELARSMCKSRNLNRIPILMLTGVNQKLALTLDKLDIDNSWMPVSDFLEKPVHPRELVSKVKAMLQAAGV